MKIDYNNKDFKQIKNKEKSNYYICNNKQYIEIPHDVFRVYRNEYQKILRHQKEESQRLEYYEDESTITHRRIDFNRDTESILIEQIYTNDLLNKLMLEIKKLSYEEQLLIFLLYFKEESESNIAKKLGISQVAVSKRKKKILKKLKNGFKNTEL